MSARISLIGFESSARSRPENSSMSTNRMSILALCIFPRLLSAPPTLPRMPASGLSSSMKSSILFNLAFVSGLVAPANLIPATSCMGQCISEMRSRQYLLFSKKSILLSNSTPASMSVRMGFEKSSETIDAFPCLSRRSIPASLSSYTFEYVAG